MPFLKIAAALSSLPTYIHGHRLPQFSRSLSSTTTRHARRRFRNPRFPSSNPLIAEDAEEEDDVAFEGEDEEELAPMQKLPDLASLNVNLLEQDVKGGEHKRANADVEHSELNRLRDAYQKEADGIERRFAELNAADRSADAEIKGLFSEEQRKEVRDLFSRFYDSGFFNKTHQISTDFENMSQTAILHLQNFNNAMEASRMAPQDNRARLHLWRSYGRSKTNVPGFLNMISKEIWLFLWRNQSHDSASNPNRLSHLKSLAEDMIEAGHPLSQEQRFARVEGHFLDGNQDMALHLWEAGLKDGDAGNPGYLELGIRMYSHAGNIARAEELLEVLFKLYTAWDPRVITSILLACIRLKTETGYAQAFGLYLRLRDRLNTDMSMEDYDQISIGFLNAGQKDYALAVFRDMILAGHSDSKNDIYAIISERMGSFISLSKDAQEVNHFGLASLSFVPRRFHNKFFYASWMRKLIAMGNVDDAAQVAELMVHRGVYPDPMHISGIIAGWFRSNDKASMLRGEKLAWTMIQARLDFVRRRRMDELARSNIQTTELDVPERSIYDHTEGAQIPTLSEGHAPPATIETFSILVQWYLRRGKFENVRHLRNLLVPCQIPMNSFFMNHLLYAELRNRTHRDAWARFEVMSRTVTPDVETFACLWECMRSHVDPARNQDPHGYPTPRELFARMLSWFTHLSGPRLRDTQANITQDLYDEIIHCFCMARDLEGSFVALQALKDMWGLVPQSKTMRMVIMQIARMNAPPPLQLGKPSRRKSRQISASKANKDNLAHVTGVFDMIVKDRHEKMLEQGVKFADLNAEQQGEDNHRALLQLLYTAMMEIHGKSFDADQAINDAASELGIEEIDVHRTMALLA